MGVYIPNMDKPDSCRNCRFTYFTEWGDGFWHCCVSGKIVEDAYYNNYISRSCPLKSDNKIEL